MSQRWNALRASLMDQSGRLSFLSTFRDLQSDPRLAGFGDPVGLLDFLHRRGSEPTATNGVLRALVAAAQSGPARLSDTAVTLLILALWPGLDAIRARLQRDFRDAPDDLATELAGRICDGILNLDLGRVAWIAATLLRNLQRDLLRRVISERVRRQSEDDVADEIAAPDREGPILGLPQGAGGTSGLYPLHAWLECRVGADALLVLCVSALDFLQVEAAALLGITHDAARKRHQRAIKRLRQGWDARPGRHLSHSVPRTGLYPMEQRRSPPLRRETGRQDGSNHAQR